MVENRMRATPSGDLGCFRTMVPRNVRVSEAPSYAMPVVEYDPMSNGQHCPIARWHIEMVLSRLRNRNMRLKWQSPRAERRGLGRGAFRPHGRRWVERRGC